MPAFHTHTYHLLGPGTTLALLTNAAISEHFRSVEVDKSAAVHISIALSTRAEILPISCMDYYNKDNSE